MYEVTKSIKLSETTFTVAVAAIKSVIAMLPDGERKNAFQRHYDDLWKAWNAGEHQIAPVPRKPRPAPDEQALIDAGAR